MRTSENQLTKLKSDLDKVGPLYKKEEGEKNRIGLLLEEVRREREVKVSELEAER